MSKADEPVSTANIIDEQQMSNGDIEFLIDKIADIEVPPHDGEIDILTQEFVEEIKTLKKVALRIQRQQKESGRGK